MGLGLVKDSFYSARTQQKKQLPETNATKL
jgi:hypothetical protein